MVYLLYNVVIIISFMSYDIIYCYKNVYQLSYITVKLNMMCNCNVVIILIRWIVIGLPAVLMQGNALKEYCPWEKFTASCNNNEVIIMQTALYGLMKKTRCVEDDYLIYLGCSSNQLDYVDRKCSGLSKCEIEVAYNKEMKDKIETMCPEPYFEGSYICQKVETSSNKCTQAKNIDIKVGPHYISSAISKETGCGFGNTPWVITAKSGQNINLTLIDFAWGSRSHDAWNQPQKCQNVYGHILSIDGNIIDICGGSQRMKHVHTIPTHQVQIVIQQDLPEEVEFLIKFEAIGCPDYIPPKNTWMRKDDSNLVIGCHSTSESWQLKCVGTHWIGVVGNCTEAVQSNQVAVIKDKGKSFSGHHVFAFAIGCIAVILCCITINLGIYFIRRYKIKIKSKSGNYQNSEQYLLPNATWTSNGNTTTINRDNMNTGNFQTGGRIQLPSSVATLNRGDTETVQYFVLERPPGYVDNTQS